MRVGSTIGSVFDTVLFALILLLIFRFKLVIETLFVPGSFTEYCFELLVAWFFRKKGLFK